MKHKVKNNPRKSRRIRKVAKIMINFLQAQGIKVMRYDAFSTNSIYLKLDYGLCYSVRISDHAGKQHLTYRFNAIDRYRGPKYVKTDWGWSREFYSLKPDELNQLCVSIIKLRAGRIDSLGVYGYQQKMEEYRHQNLHAKGFWELAQDLG
ncbi:hypothetical protein [Lentilactobacillus sp. SPB1-3]|uniref:Uncharacterized protein n=1 Tax=Lentilactobacillus terminaliae TaxID=3003483 RepID=A0ACD5DDN2_9LACO|nr:hypothetical protein [Lentilactobacillus sp. SPB1-3]MCZ0978016.1 hypothetical protein [Lentilactobacillus sp. SPB1-3]